MDIADMGKGEGDQLSGIGRIGQDFLISGHRGVEDQLSDHIAGGTNALAGENRAVGEYQSRGSVESTHRWHDSVPSSCMKARYSRAACIFDLDPEICRTLRLPDSAVKRRGEGRTAECVAL